MSAFYSPCASCCFMAEYWLSSTCALNSELNRVLNRRIVIFLGKFSSILFRNHFYWFTYLKVILEKSGFSMPGRTVSGLAILCSLVSSILVLFLEEPLRKLLRRVIRPLIHMESEQIDEHT